MSTPSGYAALDAPASGASAVHGSWFGPASSSGVTTTAGTSAPWATIEVAIQP
jgi:hypothetical protein